MYIHYLSIRPPFLNTPSLTAPAFIFSQPVCTFAKAFSVHLRAPGGRFRTREHGERRRSRDATRPPLSPSSYRPLRVHMASKRYNGRPSLLPIFLLAVSLRILNALVSRTFFQPDEYWQSLEVAHRLVFGYGYQTWEWRDLAGMGGIRSALYPLLFVPVYRGLEVTGLDRTGLLVRGSRPFSYCLRLTD